MKRFSEKINIKIQKREYDILEKNVILVKDATKLLTIKRIIILLNY